MAFELGIAEILVPAAPGIVCAQGLIVSDLKEFSKKTDQVKKRWVDLNQVVDKAVSFCKAQIHRW